MSQQPNCVFCKIARGELPSKKQFEDDVCFAIEDLHPKAPIHLLFIPKEHIESLAQVQDPQIMARIFTAINKVTREKGIDTKGFRTVINTGIDGGQVVFHLHVHVLAGTKLPHAL